jgi:hypothetical protein
MPNDPIPADVCARMGVPEGSVWGHNAAEIRKMQQNAGIHPSVPMSFCWVTPFKQSLVWLSPFPSFGLWQQPEARRLEPLGATRSHSEPLGATRSHSEPLGATWHACHSVCAHCSIDDAVCDIAWLVQACRSVDMKAIPGCWGPKFDFEAARPIGLLIRLLVAYSSASKLFNHHSMLFMVCPAYSRCWGLAEVQRKKMQRARN